MENVNADQQVDNSFANGSEISNYLKESAKWGKFLAIVGYVGIGLMVLLSIFVMIGFSIASQLADTGFPMGLFGFVYLVIAAIYYFPVTYLYKFSIQMRNGLNANDQLTITDGFKNLKSLFKFMGIFTIVVLSLYALILIIILPLTMLFASQL